MIQITQNQFQCYCINLSVLIYQKAQDIAQYKYNSLVHHLANNKYRTIFLLSKMLIDFKDIWWECT